MPRGVNRGASAGAETGSREPSPSGLGPTGFDPARGKDNYAIRESGWIELDTGWKFLFGGSFAKATDFYQRGILDAGGFTVLGQKLRDTYGRGKAGLLDRVPASAIEARSDATPKSDAAEGESAVAKPGAQKSPS